MATLALIRQRPSFAECTYSFYRVVDGHSRLYVGLDNVLEIVGGFVSLRGPVAIVMGVVLAASLRRRLGTRAMLVLGVGVSVFIEIGWELRLAHRAMELTREVMEHPELVTFAEFFALSPIAIATAACAGLGSAVLARLVSRERGSRRAQAPGPSATEASRTP